MYKHILKIKSILLIIIFSIIINSGGLFSSESIINWNKNSLKEIDATNTVYSGQINMKMLIQEFSLPNAQINFYHQDTINNIETLVYQGLTDINGELNFDSLDLNSSYVAIEEFGQAYLKNRIIVTNNGTAASHFIQFSNTDNTAGKGFIINLQGQLITMLDVNYNPSTQMNECTWNGTNTVNGIYIFYSILDNQTVSAKINHQSNYNGFSSQPYSSGIVLNQFVAPLKSSELDVFKFRIEVISAVSVPFNKIVYIEENNTYDFEFSLEHIPILPAAIDGYITINQITFVSGATMFWENLYNNHSFTISTDTNGYYNKHDVDVPLDPDFTFPEKTRYYITVTIDTNTIFKIDPHTVVSGQLTSRNFNINLFNKKR